MANIDVKITNNKEAVLTAFKDQVAKALDAIGSTAEGFAKDDCPVDTGRLRNSISYAVENGEVYIGTNVEYAPAVEFRDIAHKTGKAHFLRDAATTHSDEYQAIMEASLRT